jgi:hypothetical protein
MKRCRHSRRRCSHGTSRGLLQPGLYKTLHEALGFRIETVDIAIGKLRR